MAKVGYIKLYRQVQDHWLYAEKPYDKLHAWIDLLLLANHEDVKAMVNDKLVVYRKGTVNRSIASLAERWGWSRKKARAFISVLEKDGMLVKMGHTKGTTLFLENYSLFQGQGPNTGNNKDAIECAMGCAMPPTNNNVKNDKNVNKRRSGGKKQSNDVIQEWLDRKMAEQEAEENGEEEDG